MFYYFRLAKSERAKNLVSRYEKFLVTLGELREKMFNDWSIKVAQLSHNNLQQPLLVRHLNKEISLNFNPQVF